jgi:hypothetical protein
MSSTMAINLYAGKPSCQGGCGNASNDEELGRYRYDDEYDGYKRVCDCCDEFVGRGRSYCDIHQPRCVYCNKHLYRYWDTVKLCEQHYSDLLPEIEEDRIRQQEESKARHAHEEKIRQEERKRKKELSRLKKLNNKVLKPKPTEQEIQAFKDAYTRNSK